MITMKKIIEQTALNSIARDILSGVMMLELADEESAYSDIDFYLPRIKNAAEDLQTLSDNAPAAPAAPKGGSADG